MAIANIGGIPVYDALITDAETGMLRISLVDDPAVMSNFLSFSNERKALAYQVQDEEKRLVRGVVMRADFPIYRRDAKMGEYYIIYKAEQIRIMAEKYLLESRQNEVNIMHKEGSEVDGVQMVQYFIKDIANGVNPSGFEGIADGSLFAEFHVVNDEVWNAVKDGTYKGFSLEGYFELQPSQEQEKVSKIADALEGLFSKINIKHTRTMGNLKRFKAALLKALAEFANVTTDKGILAWEGDEDLKVGDAVFIEDAEGNKTPAEDGEYLAEDSTIIIVAEGKVAEIVEAEVAPEAPEADAPEVEAAEEPAAEEAPAPEYASVATDKGNLFYEGEIAVDVAVFVEDAEGNKTPAEDGDYVLEDGTTLKVAEGKVAEVVEAETPAEETAPAEEIEALKAENKLLRSKVYRLQREISALKAQPLAKSAHDEVVASAAYTKTGDKGLDKLSKYLSR